jgi:hypothetical protein
MRKNAYALAGIAVAVCTVTGCAQHTGDELPHTSPTEASVGTVKFQGPWAGSFAQEYRDATRKDAREALQDGKITDAEYAYFESEIVSCLSDLGVRNAKLTDGQWQYSRPDSIPDSKVDDCMRSNGIQVMALRDSIVANPSNVDQDAALVACLVRKKAVPAGYSVKDYKRELSVNKYSFDLNSNAFSECNDNPLGK